MTKPTYEELFQARKDSGSPLFNDQPLKLGVFGANCSYGFMASMAPSNYELSWDHTKKIAQKAESLDFEAMVPIARWRGMGGPSNFNGENFETHTWAAGLAEATEKIMVFSTTHVPTKHPLVAAKESVTVDHISNGRFGLNMTMGWFAPELAMFGHDQREHDERYQVGGEWIDIIKRIWTEKENFDYDGKYFQLTSVESMPKPIQAPYPVLVNAGNSPAGLDFCARECDFNFIAFADFEEAAATSQRVRSIAAEHKRDLGIISYGNVITADTEKEVKQLYQHILDHGDWEVAASVSEGLGSQSGSFDQIKAMQERFITGYGGYPLIGTPEQITEQLLHMNKAGVNGFLVGFLDYLEGLDYWGERIAPLLVEAGLRI